MKKHISITAAVLCACLCFCGCAKKADEKQTVKKENISRPAQSAEKKEEAPEAVQSEPAPETVPEQAPEAAPEQAPQTETHSSFQVNLSGVRMKIEEQCGVTDSMALDLDAISNLYSIENSVIKQASGFVTMSGTFPHEAIMAEALTPEGADKIEAALKSRLGEVLNQSKSYDAQNYALAQQCKVLRNGKFVALFLSPDSAKMEEIYLGILR